MPPKVSKKEEEDLKKLQDELKKKEEEEKLKQEMQKFQGSKISTGLEMFITDYFFMEIEKATDPVSFSKEYITNLLKAHSFIGNFKPLDV